MFEYMSFLMTRITGIIYTRKSTFTELVIF
uniref:Uncharacterized protein n=1 Tax=Arundo donax TaxID=35708 RepID=A0A0A8YN24_ARUDO